MMQVVSSVAKVFHVPNLGNNLFTTVSPAQKLNSSVYLHTLGDSKILVCSDGTTVVNPEQDVALPKTVSEYNIIVGCDKSEAIGLTDAGY